MAVLGTASLFALSGTAYGAVATYPGEGLPDFIDHGEESSRTTVVPPGRPPAIDIDVVTLNISAPSNSAEQGMSLRNPSGVERLLINLGCTSYPGVTFALDQQAPGNPFGGGGTCPPASGATYKPSDSPTGSTPLTDLLGPSSGTWTMTYDDAGAVSNPGGFDAILGSWALRITHEPLALVEAIKKQKLRPKLKFKATCNGNCSLTVAGNVKTKTVNLLAGIQTLIKVKLKDTALDRLEDSGSAKLKLTTSNDLAESVKEKAKIKIKR
jgi:hypothetical protein